MSSKKVIVINGHPGQSSLSKSLTQAYIIAARDNGHDLRYHDISQMQFDPDYGDGGYKSYKPLEPDLEQFLQDLEWADHVVLATPMWWGSIPAKLKGLFDRVLIPGRTFDTRKLNIMGAPTPMLKGKTARVFLTSDTPTFWLKLVLGNAIRKTIAGHTLGFIGVKPTRFTYFAPATHPKANRLSKWLKRAECLGAQAA